MKYKGLALMEETTTCWLKGDLTRPQHFHMEPRAVTQIAPPTTKVEDKFLGFLKRCIVKLRGREGLFDSGSRARFLILYQDGPGVKRERHEEIWVKFRGFVTLKHTFYLGLDLERLN